MATQLTVTPALATQAALDALTKTVTALATQLGVDEATLAKLVAAVPPVAPPMVTAPGTVSDLAVVSTTPTSATLSFTEVTDGAGAPASYDLRFALGTLSWSAVPGTAYPGTAVGAKRTLTVLGLTPGSAYQFQVLAYRGTLDVNAVFGALSNVAPGTTAASGVLPPPPPPSGGWPNEPPGMILLSDEPFNALVENGWRMVQRQATNGSGIALVADPAAPHSPPGVLQFTYAKGFVAGSEPGAEFYNPPSPVSETYFAFWWKPSNPFQNEPLSNVNKIAFLLTPASDIYIMMQAVGSRYRIAVEPEFPGDTRVMAPNVQDTDVVLGQWHLVEWYVKCATNASSRDGVTKWWLDGVLQGSYADLQTPGDGGFTEYQLAPTWGGLFSVKAETDYYWFDHARISRR